MSAAIIDRDAWLAAIGEAVVPDDPNALTSRELGEMLGLERTATQRRIKELLQAKKIEVVSKRVTGSSGAAARVPAYRLIPKVKGKR